MVGFKAERLKTLKPIIEQLQSEFPSQEWNVMNSRFPKIYDFILCGFADSRDESHKIGLSVVRKYMKPEWNMTYWVKEINLTQYNVEQ